MIYDRNPAPSNGPSALCSHRFDFIYDLFEHVSSRNNQDTLKCGSKHRRPTVSSQFKVSLAADFQESTVALVLGVESRNWGDVRSLEVLVYLFFFFSGTRQCFQNTLLLSHMKTCRLFFCLVKNK